MSVQPLHRTSGRGRHPAVGANDSVVREDNRVRRLARGRTAYVVTFFRSR